MAGGEDPPFFCAYAMAQRRAVDGEQPRRAAHAAQVRP
jgi:hypothetical protein